MDIIVYDQNINAISIIDLYDSLIWNIGYSSYGEFELVVPFNEEFSSDLQIGNYLTVDGADGMMIIEKVVPIFDNEKGYLAKFSGRSLESILSRRIVWKQTTISGDLQTGIKQLINDAIINPTNTDRKIDNFIFNDSTDATITSITIDEHQYTGDNLYDVVKDLCDLFDLGFRITLNSSKQFVFELYSGVNRTSDQVQNPVIEFSTNNDNLLFSQYSTDKTNYCNVTLIAGEDEDSGGGTTVVPLTNSEIDEICT